MNNRSRLEVANHDWKIFAAPGTFRRIDGQKDSRIQSAFELCKTVPPAPTLPKLLAILAGLDVSVVAITNPLEIRCAPHGLLGQAQSEYSHV